MNSHRIDSAQVLAVIGSAGGFALANFDRIAAALCALIGLGYTLWKWRREARADDRRAARASRRTAYHEGEDNRP